MIRTGWLATLIVALAPWPCPAQFGGMGGMGGLGGPRGMGMNASAGEDWTVKFETFQGQAVTGTLRLPSVSVECSLGLYEIKPARIKSIQFRPPTEPMIATPFGAQRDGSVVTDSGETVVGKVHVPNHWRVETDLGTLTPDANQLKTLTFLARVRPDPPKPPGAVKPSDPKPSEARPGGPPPVEPAGGDQAQPKGSEKKS